MKAPSLKLQRIAAVVAIITAPMPVFAVNGPDPATWIPGADVVETVGSVSTRRQPGPYNSRDVYKVFVTAVAGKDLRLVVTGSTGVKVDYFDERRTNGLYAVFGAVDPGTMTLSFQTAPTGTSTWTTVGTKALTVGARRTMNHDTEVPIAAWWDCKAGITPYPSGVTNPTPAIVEARLNTDFINMKADGFNCVNIIWKASWDNAKTTIYANLTQHGMKIQQNLYAANAYISAGNMEYPLTTHHNVKLLALETLLNQDMLAVVEGTTKLKDHPKLFSYYTVDEAPTARVRAVALEAMLAKNIDPFHGSGSSVGGLHGSFVSNNIVYRPFSDFTTVNLYPLANADTIYCPGCPATATSDFSKSNWQPGQYGYTPVPNYLDWVQAWDPRRPLEIMNQTHVVFGALRRPSPKELRALVMMSASQGSRPFNYFIYGWFAPPSSLRGLLDPGFARTPQLDEARLINAKLATWIPTYKNLKVSTIGSTPIAYSYPSRSPVTGNFTHKTTGHRYLLVVNTDTVNTKTVTVNGIKNQAGGTAASIAKAVPNPSTPFTYSAGTLKVTLPAGDGELFRAY